MKYLNCKCTFLAENLILFYFGNFTLSVTTLKTEKINISVPMSVKMWNWLSEFLTLNRHLTSFPAGFFLSFVMGGGGRESGLMQVKRLTILSLLGGRHIYYAVTTFRCSLPAKMVMINHCAAYSLVANFNTNTT